MMPKKEYVIFETVGEVTTGRGYKPGQIDSPYRQFCYRLVPSGEPDVSEMRNLSTKKPGRQIVESVSNDKVDIAARKNCRYL